MKKCSETDINIERGVQLFCFGCISDFISQLNMVDIILRLVM